VANSDAADAAGPAAAGGALQTQNIVTQNYREILTM